MSVVGLSRPVLVALDIAIGVAIEVAAGYLVHRIPAPFFARDRWLFRARRFEAGGRVYERVLRIRRWKPWLPEFGDFFEGGFNKGRLSRRDDAHVSRYIGETRRAELGHWLPVVVTLAFFSFNPWYVALVVVLIGLFGNAPFISAQRYNRIRLQRLLDDRARRRAGAQRKIADR